MNMRVRLEDLQKLYLNNLPREAGRIVSSLENAGGAVYLIGGSVRDCLIGFSPKDLDFEVFGLGADVVQSVLVDTKYPVSLVGKNFGVFKVKVGGGLIYDVSLPRTESKEGRGKKGFIVNPDPLMTLEDAASRRDFTVNSMSFRPSTGRFYDPFKGTEDLAARILRHISEKFKESPERCLRLFQFASRLGARVDPGTAALCSTMLSEYDTIEPELVWAEWVKFTKGMYPSKGLEALKVSGWIALYPELHNLVGLRQDVRHHPEGDVFTHTGLVCDVMSLVAAREGKKDDELIAAMLGAVCHDMGKYGTTRDTFSHFCEDHPGKSRHSKVHRGESCQYCGYAPPVVGGENGENFSITSYDHQNTGVSIALSFLNRIGAHASVQTRVSGYVKHHMTASLRDDQFKKFPKVAVLSLAEELSHHSLTVRDLDMMVESDASGRFPALPARPLKKWLEMAEILGCSDAPIGSIITGDDLLAMGMQPSKELGEALRRIREAQISGKFSNRESGIRWTKHNILSPFIKGKDLLDLGYTEGPELGRVLKQAAELQFDGILKSREDALDWAKNQKSTASVA